MTAATPASLAQKVHALEELMIAYVTGRRSEIQPRQYSALYAEITVNLERAKYPNPNPHRSLESFWSHCTNLKLGSYAERRSYVRDLYADVLLDLKRREMNKPESKVWKKANDALSGRLQPVRNQWLKAKNFIHAPEPDFENSVKESISSVEACLMILLDEPNGTLGQMLKSAGLDPDIQRLISQAYGVLSNRAGVRHGGIGASLLGREEAEFFLDFAASAIVYISSKAVRKTAAATA